MSTIAAARAGFLAAINSVAGLTYHAATPATPREGDAWLRWRAERDGDAGGISVTWTVAIVTPQDEDAADTWIDQHIDLILSALRRVAYVTGYGPASFERPGGTALNGLLITTDRE